MKKSTILYCALFLFLLRMSITAQTYPDTIWVPVIFYDYHADGSNPDFKPCASGLTLGMVDSVLDRDHKPVPRPAACSTAFASHLGEWFRVSGTGGPNTASQFLCDSLTNPKLRRWYWTNLTPYKGRTGEFTGPGFDSTNSIRNIVIYDSLPFIHKGKSDPSLIGIYEYSSDAFFKLDNRGFGAEPSVSGHNNGFAMELHLPFQYKKNLVFNLGGTGDFWAFINGNLIVDYGGKHGPLYRAVNLDSVFGLVEVNSYPLDVFYAQRGTDTSGIRITFAIPIGENTCCSSLWVGSRPSDTVWAGDTATILGVFLDPYGNKVFAISDSIQWSQVPPVLPGDKILSLQGDTTKFTSNAAFRTVKIVGAIQYGDMLLQDTAVIYIKPGNAYRIVIGPKVPLPFPNPFDTLVIPANENSKSVYATLRDLYDNFIGYAKVSQWVSLDTSIVTVKKGDSLSGEGVVTRNPLAKDSVTRIYAVLANSNIHDTLIVKIIRFNYTELKLRFIIGNDTNPKNLVMTINQDTTIKAQIWNSIDSIWTDTPVVWRNSANLKIDPLGLTDKSWHFSPLDTGSGWISATLNGVISFDTLPVQFTSTMGLTQKPLSFLADRWSIATSGNSTRIHIPLRGTHLIKAYSLSGSIIYTTRTCSNDVQIKLPTGVFIVSVQTIGSVERFTTKIFNQ